MGPLATLLIVLGSIVAYIFCGIVVSAVTVAIGHDNWDKTDREMVGAFSGIFWPLWIIGWPLWIACVHLHKTVLQVIKP